MQSLRPRALWKYGEKVRPSGLTGQALGAPSPKLHGMPLAQQIYGQRRPPVSAAQYCPTHGLLRRIVLLLGLRLLIQGLEIHRVQVQWLETTATDEIRNHFPRIREQDGRAMHGQ